MEVKIHTRVNSAWPSFRG